MLHIPTDIQWIKGWPGLALIRKEVASLWRLQFVSES